MAFTRPDNNKSIWRIKPDVIQGSATTVKADWDKLLNDNTDDLITVIGELEAATGAASIGAKSTADATITVQGHISNVTNPHAVTKAQVGLGSVDNTADVDKPVPSAVTTALGNKVDKVTGKSLVSDTEITRLAGISAYTHPNHSGDVTSVADGAQTIANKAVTLAKMNDMATASLIYRKTAGEGAPEVNSLATLKTDLAFTAADVGAADASHSHSVSDITDLPSIPSELSDLSGDETHRTVTDTEKTTWNGKQDALEFTAANDSDVVHDTGNETVAGIKTFSSFPVTPSSAPSSDYQIANKKYVDDSVSEAGGGDMLKAAYDTNSDGKVNSADAVTGLSVASGKTLTASNTLTLTATDGSTLAVGAGGTLGTSAYTAAYAHPNHSGDVTSVADGATTIANGAVTLAKMANMATASLIYRKTAEAGAPEVNSLATLKTDLAYTASDVGAAAASHNHAASDINSGTLTVAQGGTGAATLTSGAILKGAGTSAITTASEGTDYCGIDTNNAGKINPARTSAKLRPYDVSITLDLTHCGCQVYMVNGSAVNVTIPTDISVAFPDYSEIEIVRGVAAVTIVAASGVTIHCEAAARTIAAQYAPVYLKKTGNSEWLLTGRVG